MIKDILAQYCDLQKEIKNLNNRIEKLDSQSSMVSDVVQNGYKRHAVIFGVDVLRQKRLELLKNKLKTFNNKLFELQIELEEYIEHIPDSKTREIFRYRYYDNMTWYQIAQQMEYNDENAPRKKHDRFLEKNI